MEIARGDYTIAGSFKTPASGVQRLLTAAEPASGSERILVTINNGVVVVAQKRATGSLRSVSSGGGLNDGNWHHFAAVVTGLTLSLFIDGAHFGSATVDSEIVGPLDVTLGSDPVGGGSYYAGGLDELVLIPSAVDGSGVLTLMNSTYPALSIDDDFVTFTANGSESVISSGAARVEEDAISGVQSFEQEVEAALQLAEPIVIPVTGQSAADLVLFYPFEDVPGSTSFENLAAVNSLECAGDSCPTAGLRGPVDRALFFDGIDDTAVASFPAGFPELSSIAVWAKADRGTIIDTRNSPRFHGIELDFNRLRIATALSATQGYRSYQTLFTLPENEWAHLAMTLDRSTGLARVYVNGAEVASVATDLRSSNNKRVDGTSPVTVGSNVGGGDPLHGFVDDLRAFSVTLTAAQVLKLYQDSAPIMRFEFDEDEDATSFVDSSINRYVGRPTVQSCASLTMSTLTVNALSTSPSNLYVAQDGRRVAYIPDSTAETTHVLNIGSVVCDRESLEAGIVESDGTTTSLGSLTLDVDAPGSESRTFAGGGNSLTLSWTLDEETTPVLNTLPGTDGQIGNTALFDGNGHITVDGAGEVARLTDRFTVMAWIKPDALQGRMRVLSPGQSVGERGWSVGTLNDKLLFTLWRFPVVDYVGSATELEANIWQHVAVVFEDLSVRFYVDGSEVQTLPTDSVTLNTRDSVLIGARQQANGNILERFRGEIDELSVHRRPLSTDEIFSIYRRELRWYRDRASSFITIDDDEPNIELLTDHPYRPNGFIQLAISATDDTSSVAGVDFGLMPPGATAFTWTAAPPCEDTPAANATWCPSFDSSQLGGEGEYLLKFRAVDLVLNEATSREFSLLVDNTPPQVASTYAGDLLQATPIPDHDVAWTISLSGAAFDPGFGPGIPGSGVDPESISVSLIDSRGAVLNGTRQRASLAANQWSVDYEAQGARPGGEYTVRVEAADAVGNSVARDVGRIHLDTRPPHPDIDARDIPENAITSALTIPGTLGEQTNWAGAVARFHFEDQNGPPFRDSSGNENDAACVTCPSTAAGPELTLSAWVRPDALADRAMRIVTLGADKAILVIVPGQRLLFVMNLNGQFRPLYGDLVAAAEIHHVAGTYDGETMRLYHNGTEVGTLDVVGTVDSSSILKIGHVSDPYDGLVDEVVVYDRALSAGEVYGSAQRLVAGVANVKLAFEPVDLSVTRSNNENIDASLWQPGTLEQAGRFSTWSGQGEEPPPEGLGGGYPLSQTDPRRPAGQVVGHRLDGQPGAVGGEAARGEMVQPDAVLEVAYGILDLGVAAMVSLQFEQLPVPVGDEAMIAVFGEEGQLGTGRRLHPPDDEPYRRGVRLGLEGGAGGLGHIGGTVHPVRNRRPGIFGYRLDEIVQAFVLADGDGVADIHLAADGYHAMSVEPAVGP